MQPNIKIRGDRQLSVETVVFEEHDRLSETEKKLIEALSSLFALVNELENVIENKCRRKNTTDDEREERDV